jgi:hypothetical protein
VQYVFSFSPCSTTLTPASLRRTQERNRATIVQELARNTIRDIVYDNKKAVAQDQHWNWEANITPVVAGVQRGGRNDGPWSPVDLPAPQANGLKNPQASVRFEFLGLDVHSSSLLVVC